MPGQQGVNRAAEVPYPLAVNEADLTDPALLAHRQVLRHEILEVFGPKGVEIQHPINR